jgi:hypothetical protein
MSRTAETGYQFGDRVPINPINQGSTVLVAGPPLSGSEDLVRAMVTNSALFDEGGLFISTNMTVTEAVAYVSPASVAS